MFSAAEKTNQPATVVQQKAQQQSFFRKAEEESFFGGNERPSFFNAPVQAKLAVSSPDDPQEKEADAVAETVMRMPDPVTSISASSEEKLDKKEEEEVQPKIEAPAISKISRKEDEVEEIQAKHFTPVYRMTDESLDSGFSDSYSAGGSATETISRKKSGTYHSDIIQRSGRSPPRESIPFEQTLSSSKGSGNALPVNTREFMESRFNADFSGVRIHTGATAQSMSSNIHAQAFAHGNDIYFNEGKFSPQTESGGTLLAHELTHTIQQKASPIQRKSDHTKNTVARKEIKSALNSVPVKNLNAGQVILQRRTIDESLLSRIDFSDKSGGRQLPQGAKDYLEDYYKTNLSDIRIFTDNEIASLCRAAGIKAFTKDKNIGIISSAFDPESEDGAVLLSDQVSKSLKQRGIRSTAADGNDIGGTNSLISQILAAVKENKEDEKNPAKDTKGPSSEIESKDKKQEQTGKEEIRTTDNKGENKKLKKAKLKAKDKDGIGIKPVKRNPKKSPSTPDEDPAFQKVVKKTKEIAKGQKQHDDAEKKSAEAQNSAEAVPKEAESKAQNRKTDGLGEAAKEDKPFDAAAFKADLLKKIEAVTPKNLEEATEFKENNKIEGVKAAMGEKVSSEKQNTTGPVNNVVQQPLQVNGADNKQPVPLPPTPTGPLPGNSGAKNAAPKNKLDGEISMEQQSQSLDEEMNANNVTEEQLASSNEPTFSAALDEKKNAQKDAIEKPNEYRKEEALTLKEAKADVNEKSVQTMAGMHGARGKSFDASVTQQQTAKQKDEEKRAAVAKTIEEKFAFAEQKVNTALEDAEKLSSQLFDEGAEAARVQFENYVDVKMYEYKRRRYSGFWGGLRWAKDKLFGMPDEVNRFYSDGRELYLKKMDEVITQVANVVTTKLNEAKKAITDGKKEIDEYVSQLPKDLKDVGKEAAESIQDKFDTLEQSVNDKRDGLIDGLAKKYVDNVKKLDDRIGELKEANKGLVDKAIGFLKKVWQVIKDLTNLFTTILARLASIIGVILGSPSGFFENLGKAFKTGFDNFKNKFTEYLELGLMEWLATNLGIKGIELPKKFDASAIFSLALQVMGITKVHIKERAVALLGERKVALLEKAGGLIYRVYNEGLGVIWDMIVEKLTDFKELVWDAIKSFIQKSIIEAALIFILSLLNPIGAFIKVCMAIYDFLMMLVKFKDRIIELLDTILSAVMNIASGAVESAAGMIEKALAKSISIIIGFLAALLRLNNIFAKIREIITRIQKRVEKALDWVIMKAYSLVRKFVEGALNLEDKATAAVEKGKQAVVGAGKKVAGAVLGWLGLTKEFTAADGKRHELFFQGHGESAVLIIKSDPTPYTNFLNSYLEQLKKDGQESEVDPVTGKTKSEVITEAKVVAGDIETEKKKKIATYSGADDKEKEDNKKTAVDKLLTKLASLSVPLFGAAKDKPKDNEIVVPAGANTNDFASTQEARLIWNTSKVKANGSGPDTSAKHAVYDKIDFRQKGGGSYYIRGHLINDNLGGPGKWNNLTALSRTANHEHEEKVESKVKSAFNIGAVVRYKVTASGNQNVKKVTAADKDKFPKIADFATALPYLVQITEAESKVPTSIACEAYTMRKKGDVWEDDKRIVTDTITFTVGDYADYELGKIGGTVTLDLAKLKDEAKKSDLTFAQFKNQDKIHQNSIRLLDDAKVGELENIFTETERENAKKEELNRISDDITTWIAFTAGRAFYNIKTDAAYNEVEKAFNTKQTELRNKAIAAAKIKAINAQPMAFANINWIDFKIAENINFKADADETSEIAKIETAFRSKQ